MDQRVAPTRPAEASDLDLSEQALRRAIELLFFAYRDFTADADAMLVRYGFGRAHHRVIYFVGRHPGITVSELLAILQITKQSLAPVLSQLMTDGFIIQRPDPADRRRRRLYLTAEAQALERSLTDQQGVRIAAAFRDSGPVAVDGFARVLRAIVNAEDRGRFDGEPPIGSRHEDRSRGQQDEEEAFGSGSSRRSGAIS